MSRLYLLCAVCSRKTAEGLLSGAAWGRLQLPPGASVKHRALRGNTLRVCPTCTQRDPQWRERLLGSLGIASISPDVP